jgi:hypothetical protein
VTPLLSVAFALVLAALLLLLLAGLLALTVLLVLLALLALDLLLERNGVDRRAGVRRAWHRLRGPAHRREDPAPRRSPAEADAPRPPRTPFSARLADRAAARPEAAAPDATQEAAPEAVGSANPGPATPPEPHPHEPDATETAVLPAPVAAPEGAAAQTQVLPVTGPTAAPRRPARTSRPAPARAVDPAEEPAEPADRESAMERLFAPLLESDSTEPLPAPRAARTPRRKPRGDDEA